MLPPHYPLYKQQRDKNYSNVTKIILERYNYDNDYDAMRWNISSAYSNGGWEHYPDKNYTGVNKNGRIVASGHWIYEKNWTSCIGT